MENFKKYLFPIGYIIISILVLTILLTILNYFDLLSLKTYDSLKVLFPAIAMFIGGLAIGKQTKQKGYQSGLKLGLIFIFIILLFKIIFYSNTFKLSIILFYLILLLASTLGSMIGINIKKKDK